MTEPNQTMDQGQQGQTGQSAGGGNQSGQQTPQGQQTQQAQTGSQGSQQAQTQVPPGLPPELTAVGFKSAQDVVNYIAAVQEDAQKSKNVAKELMTQVATRQAAVDDPDVTDDDFINSPKAATERVTTKLMKQFEARINPLAGQLVEGNVQLQKMQLMKDPVFGAVMPDLEGELDQFLAALPPNQKVLPNAVRTAMDYVVGKNFAKIAQKWNTIQARQSSGSAGGSGDTGGGSGGSGGQRKTVSDDELRVANSQIKAGIFKDMDDYVKWRDGEEA